MGGIASAIFGGGQRPSSPPPQPMPQLPDYEAERKKAEAAAQKKRSALAEKGMSGAILGGSLGDESGVKKKKLLGE